MPRQARIDPPSALHHIMVRGIERRKLFQDNKDRDNIFDRVAISLKLPQHPTTPSLYSLTVFTI